MFVRCETRRQENMNNLSQAIQKKMDIVDIVLFTSLCVPPCGAFCIAGRKKKREIKRGMDGEMEGDVESGGGHRGTERRG